MLWGNEDHNLVHVLFNEDWDWVTFYARCGEIAQLFATVPHKVDVLMDLRDSSRFPDDLPIHIERASFTRRNVGCVVILQPVPPLQAIIGQVKNRLGPQEEILYASTLDAAYQLIERCHTNQTSKKPRFLENLRFLSP